MNINFKCEVRSFKACQPAGLFAFGAGSGGMVLVNTHPDYMHFGSGKPGREEYPVKLYGQLLEYIRTRYEGQYWHALPRDVARFWKKMN